MTMASSLTSGEDTFQELSVEEIRAKVGTGMQIDDPEEHLLHALLPRSTPDPLRAQRDHACCAGWLPKRSRERGVPTPAVSQHVYAAYAFDMLA